MVSDNVFLWLVGRQLPKQAIIILRYANFLKREAEKYRRDALTRVTFLLYADHVSEHLEECKMPPLRSLARYDGFPKAFIESLSSEDSIEDMTEHMGLGEATWIEASLFLVQYFSQPERPQILSSDDEWKSPVGDIALKCIQQASGSPLAGRVALGALRALPVSYGIFDNATFRPPEHEEVLGLLENMPFHPESGTKTEEILKQIQDLGGAEGWAIPYPRAHSSLGETAADRFGRSRESGS